MINLKQQNDKFLIQRLFFLYQHKRNKYNSMQIVIEQTIKSKPQLKKRISSANFNSKKIKSILTTRQTCDEAMILNAKQYQNSNEISSRTVNYTKKNKQTIKIQATDQLSIKKVQNKTLTDLIKPVKHEKNKQQSLLIKNCDKSKLIFWNQDLTLTGNEKYLIVSADLIVDQDCFWDKISSDNGNLANRTLQNSNTLATLNHNSTPTHRNRNNFNGQTKFIPTSHQIIPINQQHRKNPLLNSTRLTTLIKEWKNLHLKCDSQSRKLIILWMIRKQSTYTYLMQFSQANQLPLHGIFYVKRKRANTFFDINPIIKQIHQRFFQTITRPVTQQLNEQALNSIDISRQLKKCNSKQKKGRQLLNTVSCQMKKNIESFTKRVMKSKLDSRNQQNDQNSLSALNSQTCKQFQLSKNIKKSLISIVIDQKKLKNIFKKNPSSANRMRPNNVKIQELIEKQEMNQNYFKQKCDISPLMKDQRRQSFSVNVIKDFEVNSQNIKILNKPQIYIFEGIKCNSKDYCENETYNGKIPIVFNFHDDRFEKISKKMRQNGLQINNNQKSIKLFYLKYQCVKDNGLQIINNSIKQILRHQTISQVDIYPVCKVQRFKQQTIEKIFDEFIQIQKQKQLRSINVVKYSQQIELSQAQQQGLIQKTQKKLQQIKKQIIDDTIRMKGRHYTFENGQSIYYFVGDTFKRNYNLLYDEYYGIYERQLISLLMKQHNNKGLVIKQNKDINMKKINDNSRTTDCSLNIGCNEITQKINKNKIQQLNLQKIQYYEFNRSY